MLSSTAKALAKNSVASVQAHNRVWEERRMWAEYESEKTATSVRLDPRRFFGREDDDMEQASTSRLSSHEVQDASEESRTKRKPNPPSPSSPSSSSRKRSKRQRSPSDSDIEILDTVSSKKKKKRKKEKKKKNKRPKEVKKLAYEHTKALFELESSIPGRWLHDGYKELHPEEFQ